MVKKTVPTAAEVSDVTNAVYDGCDALLLTGEVAYGKNPFLAVEICAKIIHEAEQRLDYANNFEGIYTYSPIVNNPAEIIASMAFSSV
jgi:pyruvate kinase